MDCARNIVTAAFPAGKTETTTAPLWQWDYGQVLCITGIEDLPAAFEVHFSTNRTGGVSTVAVGADGQVTIPNDLLTIGKNLNAWIYLSDAQGEGETEYSITIPVKPRPMPETYDAEVTGEFDDVVRQVSEYAETAQTAADNAGASATAAAASASEAAASASAAETAKTASETAQGKAEDAQAAAETAAQTATEKAQQTAQDAAQAAQSKADAESAAGRAEAAQTGAESAKTDAETAAQGAADSASAASVSATSAGQAATSAGQSATAAAGSATTAQGAAQTATTKAGEASASATAANTAKTAAQTAQTGAETAATNAGQSASTATAKAAEAAQSASGAAQSKADAEAAATRAEQAAASLTVDSALSDTSVNPVQNKVITGEVTQLKNALAAAQIVDSASGAIASFPDGADGIPVRGLTVELSPIQAGSGDPSPDNVRPITGRTAVKVWREAVYDPSADPVLNIQLGQTVYGGTVDVVSGRLTVDMAMVDLGDLSWVLGSAGDHVRFDAGISDLAPNPTDNLSGYGSGLTCSIYATDGHPITNNSVNCVIARYRQRVYVRDDRYSSASDFKTAMNGVQLVYELATPLEITLDPATLSTLKGDNNVWSDADSVTVEYVADPKLYIARLTEPDADMVADANITSGSYFMVNNTLYLATANIASGAAIVPGVNCTRTNLAAALNAINA